MMPSIPPSSAANAANYRTFLGETSREAEPAAPQLTLMERVGRFSRKQAPWVAVQRVVGGNIPMQGLVAAAGSPEGFRRMATEGGVGLINRQALVAYAAKDGLSFAAEALLGPPATWVTRSPRWVARALACAAAASLDGLRGGDVLPWLGRPDYEFPMRCAAFPRPLDCPSHTPGDIADWLEPAVAAIMIGAVAYWVLPKVAYHLQQKLTRPGAAAEPSVPAEAAVGSDAASPTAAAEDLEQGQLTQPLLAPGNARTQARSLQRAHSV